ncbi:MAG: hypothetical protein U0931_22600 [Vulcanimicrobiota bacterium]
MSLPESILAICICFMAFAVFSSVFSNARRATVQSRDRTAAILLANTLMDELEAHPYGEAAPQWWSSQVDHPVRAWVEGNLVEMDFHKRVDFETKGAIGLSAEDKDVATITISWHENMGQPQTPVVVPTDNKSLVVRYPLWRGQ